MRVSSDCKIRFIELVGRRPYTGEKYPGRKEGIRYLLGLHSAMSVRQSFWTWDESEVRDAATLQLEYLLGMVQHQRIELPESPRERILFRDRIREAAERELARPAK
jgi:hypothetical protein